jgi:citrate synthase
MGKVASMAKVDVKKRGDAFCEKVSTAIWKEMPASDNPYHVDEARCHGYEHLALINNKSFSEVLFLLFQSELPNESQRRLFDTLLLSVIHPGPRHNASRAAMNAAVSKTNTSHVLPLALNVLGGEWQGSREVFESMKFLRKNHHISAAECAHEHIALLGNTRESEGDLTLAPGYGSTYGSADSYSQKLADNISSNCDVGLNFKWAAEFVSVGAKLNVGWRVTGLFAAVLTDLGFTPYQGELLFQIASAPGIVASVGESYGFYYRYAFCVGC